jgi:hypothetical protein
LLKWQGLLLSASDDTGFTKWFLSSSSSPKGHQISSSGFDGIVAHPLLLHSSKHPTAPKADRQLKLCDLMLMKMPTSNVCHPVEEAFSLPVCQMFQYGHCQGNPVEVGIFCTRGSQCTFLSCCHGCTQSLLMLLEQQLEQQAML